ncbi:hypothetical protein BD310DRAFT_854586 [Dichomitus squalens]|uniref:Fungal-type protein kinase domain-containing protein n=1 Tax=Dichomitus squalens TaxID=114155 RepID=A0A4Q9PQU0_9APHY|nr:hypothetical protein BD310DRAFT_854586 [Dichomitus squalens]
MSISASSLCGSSGYSGAGELAHRVNVASQELDDYLAVYVPSHSNPPEAVKTNVQPDVFDQWTPTEGKEAIMYNHLIDAFDTLIAPFPDHLRLTFCDCAGQKISFPFKDHADYHVTKPDIVASFPGKKLPRMQTNPTWWTVSMTIEAKATEEQDPFGKQGQVHVDTVTQLAISARNLLFAHGFCYVFMIGLYGHSARIVRFDRSSAVVSKRFNYRERPDLLQRFFWRLVHPIIGDTLVGSDPNVRPLTSNETQWVSGQLEKLQWGMTITDEELRKGRKVMVPESDAHDAKTRDFILFDLIDVNPRLFSRATMVWLAIEDTRKHSLDPSCEDPPPKLVVFKETWRQIIRRPESHFYERLSEIPDDVRTGLPKMLYGSDVGKREVEAWKAAGGHFPYEADSSRDSPVEPLPSEHPNGIQGSISNSHRTPSVSAPDGTLTTVSAVSKEPPDANAHAGEPMTPAVSASPPLSYPLYQTHSWRLLFGDKHIARERSLVRLVVNAVGRPLKCFRSTRELVEATRDAIEGHREAWEVGVLHRDVSTGNILISERAEERFRGFLHDFDYSSMTKEMPPPLDDSDPCTDPLLCMAEVCDDDDLKERTGTYYYMSYDLLETEDCVHSVHHDLESFYWVLLWIILRHTKHDFKTTKNQPNPCAAIFQFGDDQGAANTKRGWLTKPRSFVLTVEDNKPLTDLLHAFRMLIFRTNVISLYLEPREYLTHAAVLELFDKALARTDEWPDAAKDGPRPFV